MQYRRIALLLFGLALVCMPSSTALGAAKYKLTDHSPERFVFERRYLPGLAMRICLVVLILARKR